jgi:HPt (histidine-containing phosphotransfer) domain-containing protein
LEELEQDYGKEMVLKIVEMCIPDAEARLEKIGQAVKQEDFRALKESARGLKGASRNIGATELAQICEQLETRGENHSLSDNSADP